MDSSGEFVIAGDSFLRRLKAHLNHLQKEITVNRHVVKLIGIGGATIPSLKEHLKGAISFSSARVVVLVIGGNDLSGRKSTNEISDELMGLAHWLLREKGVQKVVLFEVIHRHLSTDEQTRRYNGRVDEVNTRLTAECRDETKGIVFFRQSRGTKGYHHMCKDGVHPNRKGLQTLMNRIRTAIGYCTK